MYFGYFYNLSHIFFAPEGYSLIMYTQEIGFIGLDTIFGCIILVITSVKVTFIYLTRDWCMGN